MDLNRITLPVRLIFDPIGNMGREDKVLGIAFVSFSHKDVPEDTTFSVNPRREVFSLHFNLGKAMHYRIGGKSGVIRNKQFNFFYLPAIPYECTVLKGMYKSFQIVFPLKYLKEFEPHFSLLKEWLKAAESKVPCSLGNRNLKCTEGILRNMKGILRHPDFKTVCLETHFNYKIFYIFLESVESLMTNGQFREKAKNHHGSHRENGKLGEADKVKIEHAHQYLIAHLKDNFSADLVANEIGMDTHQLRRGFRQLYHTTMLEFHNDARMKQATTLLINTTQTLEKIAAAIGFKSSGSFIKSFKKKFKCTPNEMRLRPPDL